MPELSCKFLYISFILFRENIRRNSSSSRDRLVIFVGVRHSRWPDDKRFDLLRFTPPLWVVLDTTSFAQHCIGKTPRIVNINRINELMWAEFLWTEFED